MKLSLSKNDTLVIKGVAIIFLVFYHSMATKQRLLGHDISFFPFTNYYAFYIFESMNVCVGTFAFMSSFGLTRTITHKYLKNGKSSLGAAESTDFLTRRTISLMMAFFIPFVACTSVSLIFAHHNPYGHGETFVLNLIMDMLGFAGALGTPMMVGTWWYMSFALIIIFLMPMTVNLYRKHGIGVLIPFIVLPLLIDAKFYNGTTLNNMTRWLLCIPFGVMFADGNIFEQMKEMTIGKNKVLSKIVKFILWTAILLLAFRLRKQVWTWKFAYYIISTVLPVIFVYWLYEFVCGVPIINKLFAFFGKYSSDIFFMHTFIRAVWFPDFTYSLKYWYAVFAFVMGASLVMAIVADLFRKLISWGKLTSFVSEKASCLTAKALPLQTKDA